MYLANTAHFTATFTNANVFDFINLGQGASIYLSGAPMDVSFVIFRNITAVTLGGIIFTDAVEDSQYSLTDSEFYDISANTGAIVYD